jgi:hypothetical protein
MRIDPYVSELLYDHDCVIITDLGGFVANYKPATMNPAIHVITPPSKAIAFNSSLKNNDGLLASHISSKEEISYAEACETIREYVQDALSGMNGGQKFNIEKVGALYYDHEHNLRFLPDNQSNFLTTSFGLSTIHSPAIKREMTGKTRFITREPEEKHFRVLGWKILEIIPAAAVLAVLFIVPPALKEFNSNLSGMLPFSRMEEFIREVQGEDTSPSPLFVQPPSPFEVPPSVPAKTEARETTPPVENLKSETIPVSEPVKKINSIPAVETEKRFHVIGGCFKRKVNAEKFVRELKARNIEGTVIGRNPAGYYLVSISGSTQFANAIGSLDSIRNKIPDAWIYRVRHSQ